MKTFKDLIRVVAKTTLFERYKIKDDSARGKFEHVENTYVQTYKRLEANNKIIFVYEQLVSLYLLALCLKKVREENREMLKYKIHVKWYKLKSLVLDLFENYPEKFEAGFMVARNNGKLESKEIKVLLVNVFYNMIIEQHILISKNIFLYAKKEAFNNATILYRKFEKLEHAMLSRFHKKRRKNHTTFYVLNEIAEQYEDFLLNGNWMLEEEHVLENCNKAFYDMFKK